MDRFKQIIMTFFLSLALAGCGGGGGGKSKSSSGGSDGNSGGNNNNNGNGGIVQRPAAPTIVYIWVADPGTNSDGGLFAGYPVSADAFCASAATNQNIFFATPVNTHWGLLAFPNSEPSAFFSTTPVARRPDGTLIVADYTDFFDSSVTLANSVDTGSTLVWLGVDATTGTYVSTNSACQGWTSDSVGDVGKAGDVSATDGDRLHANTLICHNIRGIYCVSFQN